MTTTSLTDRYIWAVTRTQPEAARADLGAELRERIADQIDARLADGVAPDKVELVVLTELGHPDQLAASYTDRPLQLIGPRYYLTWWRLLKLLLAIVVPAVAGALALAFTIAGEPVGSIIGETFWITVTVALHLCFWVTLVFAIMERAPQSAGDVIEDWTPDLLPELPSDEHKPQSLSETIIWVGFLVLFAAVLIAQHFNPLLRSTEGESIPVLNPELWDFWLPYLLALIAVEVVFAVALYLNRNWNWGFVTVNVVLNLAFAVPVIWLLASGQLVNPDFMEAIGSDVDDEARRVIAMVICFVIGAIAALDILDGFRKLRHGRRLSRSGEAAAA